MKRFQYEQPESLAAASKMLRREGALPYAGGTDLLDLMKNDVAMPDSLVNLKALPGMDAISYTPGKSLRIGALVNIAEIAEHPVIQEKFTVLAQAAKEVASPQLRNVGTLGGNLCQRPRCWYYRGYFHCLRKGGDVCFAYNGESKFHCITGGGPCLIVHPSDLAVALLALNARVNIYSAKEDADVTNAFFTPIKDFFVLPEENVEKENILQPGEFLTEIEIPDLPEGTRSGYVKHKERAVWDFAVVSVAAVIRKEVVPMESGPMAFGGVAPVPWEEREVNRRLLESKTDKDSISALAEFAFQDAQTLPGNAYKVPLARNLIKRLLTDLTA
jgi:xanthine dehydrogenase YagS FAD-binding subunit